MKRIEKPFHFFASSIGEWRVSEDIEKLIKDMKRSKLTFTLWKVPVPKSETYQISMYAPQVDNSVFIGRYDYDGKTWNMVCTDIVFE